MTSTNGDRGDRGVSKRTEHPALHRNLALIGGRGCGKSSVCKRLARRNRNFMLFSVDALIRYESGGLTIPQIIKQDGWPAFRDIEYRVMKNASAFENGALLDCGGGGVVDLDPAGHEILSRRKLKALRRHGLVVYLQRETEYLAERIGGDSQRPSLSATDSFREIMARRAPWYLEAADWVIDCGDLSKREIADAVLDWFYAAQNSVRQ